MKPARKLKQRIEALQRRPGENVHNARVVTKIVRAGLKFAKWKSSSPDPEAASAAARRLRQDLKESSEALAGIRALEARRELIEWLLKKRLLTQKVASAVNGAAMGQAPAADKDAVRQIGDRAVQALEILRPVAHRKVRLRPLRKALSKYNETPNEKNLHGLRKEAKTLEYQLRFFGGKKDLRSRRRRRPGAEKKIVADLSSAGQKLGRARDLELLIREAPEKIPSIPIEKLNGKRDQLIRQGVKVLKKMR